MFKVLLIFVIGIFAVQAQNCNEKPVWNKDDAMILKNCCKMPKLFEEMAFQTCSKTVGLDNPQQQQLDGELNGNLTKMRCFAECLMNSSKIMNNGKIDMKVMLDLINSKLSGDPEWMKIVTEAANFCNDEFNKKAAEMSNHKDACGPHAGFFMKCIFGYKFGNCPDSKFDSANEKCMDKKKYFKKCNVPHL